MLLSDLTLIDVLKSLVPIGELPEIDIRLIATVSNQITVPGDGIVFNEGDSDEYVYYLLGGEIELASENNTNFHIVSGTDDARYPLAQFQPQQYTAKAIVDSLILVLDRKLLDSFLVGHDVILDRKLLNSLLMGFKTDSFKLNTSVEVNDIGNIDNDDWMTKVLQSPLYTSISVENISKDIF